MSVCTCVEGIVFVSERRGNIRAKMRLIRWKRYIKRKKREAEIEGERGKERLR